MKTIFRFLAVLFVAVLFNNEVKASHLYGGDVIYKCVGPNKYIFYLSFFSECHLPYATEYDYTMSLIDIWDNCDTSFWESYKVHFNRSLTTDVTQLCPGQRHTCTGSTDNPKIDGISKITYYTDTITLPSTCTSFSYQSYMFARIEGSVNAIGADNTYITLNGTFNTLTNNNSPTYYTPYPIPRFTVNLPFEYNFGTVGLGGNKFRYRLVNGIHLTYASGYSGAQPLPGTVTLDTITGNISNTPTKTGFYFVDVEVSEFTPSGVFLGSTTREIVIYVVAGSNQMPLGGKISNLRGAAKQINDYSLSLCDGDAFTFDAVITDADAADSLTLISNVTSELPGATITFKGSNPDTATISWDSKKAVISSDYSFSILARDNACSAGRLPGIGSWGYYITFNKATSAGPDTSICGVGGARLNASGGDTLVWSIISGDMAAVLSCDTCPNPTVKPSVTTTFAVKSNLSATCKNRDTVVVNVIPNNLTIKASVDTVICKGDSTTLDVLSGGVSTSIYKWSPEAGLSNPNIKNPIAKPTAIGDIIYTVTVDNGSCNSGKDSVKITVKALPTVNAGTDVAICKGASTTLAPTTTGLSNYSWSPATGLNLPNSQNPKATPDTLTTYTLTGTGANGCKNTDSVIVSIKPTSTSTFTKISPVCAGNNDTITYTGNAGSTATYLWSFGTDNTIVSGSGKGPYAIKWSTTGLKTITLTVTENGCSSISSDTVTVNPIPTSTFTTVSPVCAQSNSTLTYTGNASAGDNYTWKFDGGTVVSGSGKGPYQVNWTTAGTKNITLSVNNGCTSVLTTVPVVVNPIPDSVFTIAPSSLCTGRNAIITYTGNAGSSATYVWNFDGGTANPGSGKGPQQVYWSTTGTKKITLSVTENNCSSSSSKSVTVSPVPPAPAVTAPPSVCQGNVAGSFTANAGTGGTLNWYSDSQLQNSVNTGSSFASNTTSNTTFWVTETKDGCSSSASPVNLVFYDLPSVSFITTPPIPTGNMPLSVAFTSTSSADVTDFSWDLENGVTANIANPSHTYNTAGTFIVTLTGRNANCADTAQATIIVNPFSSLFIPNVFTPNGDLVNDEFKVQAFGMKEFEVIIYNRWGRVVDVLDSPDDGWNGLDCEDGTYYYVVKAIGRDEKIYTPTGFISLISKK